jgi:hypothetical protein
VISRSRTDLAEHAADYMPLRDIVAGELAAAAGGGLASTEVYVRLPAECARTSVGLTHLLDAAERLSAAGRLPSRRPTPASAPSGAGISPRSTGS